MPKAIQDRASFEIIRYANVWEDADILCRALDPQTTFPHLVRARDD